jgi:hypothetical protein
LRASSPERSAWLLLSALYSARPDLRSMDPISSPEFDEQLLRWANTYGVGIDSDARYLRGYRTQLTELLAQADRPA